MKESKFLMSDNSDLGSQACLVFSKRNPMPNVHWGGMGDTEKLIITELSLFFFF